MPIELKIIILGCLVIGCLEYLKDRKRKKEQERQDRLNSIASDKCFYFSVKKDD
tara:strand:- start:25 stop:186 length:162 start_codon:yes stop_codon:yes gene_type:complete